MMAWQSKPRQGASFGFTLVEVLAVIAVIVLLFAITIPVLSNVRASSHDAKCSSNLRQLGAATMLYANDNGGKLPSFVGWSHAISPFIGSKSVEGVFECPAAKNQYDSASARTYGYNRHLEGARLTSIANPSRIVVLADGHWSGTYFYAQVDGGIALPTPVHGEGAMALFLDQHVELVEDFSLEMFKEE